MPGERLEDSSLILFKALEGQILNNVLRDWKRSAMCPKCLSCLLGHESVLIDICETVDREVLEMAHSSNPLPSFLLGEIIF